MEIKPAYKQEIRTSVCTISLDENDIVHLNFNQNTTINEQQAWDIFDGRMKIQADTKRHLILADLRSNPKPDKQARDVTKSPKNTQTTQAMAMIVDGALSRFLGNILLNFSRPDFPMRLFTNKEEACSWLLNQKK